MNGARGSDAAPASADERARAPVPGLRVTLGDLRGTGPSPRVPAPRGADRPPRPDGSEPSPSPAPAPSRLSGGTLLTRAWTWLHQDRVLLVSIAILIGAVLLGVGMAQGKDDAEGEARDQAIQWLRDFGSGQVIVDDRTRTELVGRAGWAPDRLVSPTTCAGDRCRAEWVLSTPTLRNDAGTAGGAISDSYPVAVFGTGSSRVEVRRSGLEPVQAREAERRARAVVGEALLDSGRVEADEPTRRLFTAGRVDPRILATLAGLISGGPVRVVGLPALPGEDAADQPRRQILLANSPKSPAEFRAYFAVQQPPYQPVSAADSETGFRVLYPPAAPSRLLQGLAGS
jgi:hypothetical protein